MPLIVKDTISSIFYEGISLNHKKLLYNLCGQRFPLQLGIALVSFFYFILFFVHVLLLFVRIGHSVENVSKIPVSIGHTFQPRGTTTYEKMSLSKIVLLHPV